MMSFLSFLFAIAATGFVGARKFFYFSQICLKVSLETETFRFANYYADYMVLQRAPAEAVIWGYVPTCQPVSIKYLDQSYTATIEKIPEKSETREEAGLSDRGWRES